MSFSSFFFLLFTNLFIFFQDTVMFLGLDTVTGQLFFTPDFQQTNPKLYNFLFIPQAWTIGIEIAFYLIAPFLVRKKTSVILFLIFLSLLLRFSLFQFGLKSDPWSYRFFPTEFAFFLLGILSYRLYLKFNFIDIRTLHLKIIWGIVLSMTVFFSFFSFSGKGYIYLLLFFIGLPFLFILTKNGTRDRYVGELSYPIYLSHHLIISGMLAIGIIAPGGLSVSIITIVFSIILNELLSKRIEKIRQKRIIMPAKETNQAL
jgi:peptidoglycan/LPS O-acetylase OafA/YrhL